jgi:hypothetical protein
MCFLFSYGGGGGTGCVNGYKNGVPCGEPICGAGDSNRQGRGSGLIDHYGNACDAKIKMDEITTSCLRESLRAVTEMIRNKSGDGYLGRLNAVFGKNGNYKIIFKESSSVKSSFGNEVAAQTGNIDRGNNTITITLNTSMLPGTTSEFQKFTLFHELMHAYLQVQGAYPSHEQMLQEVNFDLQYEAARALGFSTREAVALILYASKDAEQSGSYTSRLFEFNQAQDPDLTPNFIQQIGSNYSKSTIDSFGKEISLGGKNCL